MPKLATIATATAGPGGLGFSNPGEFVKSLPGEQSGTGVRYRGVKTVRRISKRKQVRAASATTKVIRKLILPRLRKAVPKRTGALRRSLKVRRVGRRVELKGNFYSRFVSWRPKGGSSGVFTVASVANGMFYNSRSEIREAVRRQLQ